MARYKNIDWNLHGNEHDRVVSGDHIKMALLMDVRDELKHLNRTFDCVNFQQIPAILRRIRSNTSKPKKKAKP